jgi:uncharacterized sulfatase
MTTDAANDIGSALKGIGLLTETRQAAAALPPVAGPKPNILFVLVDEMRFPSVFPAGVHDAAGFLEAYMPNVHRLWQAGVKFSNYYTAATACTPARGTLITGLYSQQTWVCCTLTGQPYAKVTPIPTLNPAFPTFGKLLREAGYQTPYVGKWHVSLLHENAPGYGLEPFGFDGKFYPDPDGFNLQGTIGNPPLGYRNDAEIAATAVSWLEKVKPEDDPWCLTVSFVNPHDKQFFWAGTEFKDYNELMSGQYPPFTYYGTQTGGGAPPVPWPLDTLKNPPEYGYAAVPPNWETAARLSASKPASQSVIRNAQDAIWGGAADDPKQDGYTVVPYPTSPETAEKGVNFGIGLAPFSYWRRGLDSYTQVLSIVDQRIGEVLDALPDAVARNTLIVFASDHGEYAGAHGLLSGKVGTVYQEAFNVPLIVADPSGRFTGETETVRAGQVSSVDMLRMLVSFGHKGSQDWLTGDLQTLYGKRLDVLPMLKSAAAPGRDAVLLVTDEVTPGYFNYEDAPMHIIGLRTEEGKLGTYAHWAPGTDTIRRLSVETELYDYATLRGRAELDNINDSPIVPAAVNLLLDRIVPEELRAPLPPSLRSAQQDTFEKYRRFEALSRAARVKPAVPPETPPTADDEHEHALGLSF